MSMNEISAVLSPMREFLMTPNLTIGQIAEETKRVMRRAERDKENAAKSP